MAPDTRSSFRDPEGRVVVARERVTRLLRPHALPAAERFQKSRLATDLFESGKLVESRWLTHAELAQLLKEIPREIGSGIWGGAMEHSHLPFPSFPYEWTPEMLVAAGKVTLDIAKRCVQEGWDLKDASPFNIGFIGCRPVFLDILSFQPRQSASIWIPYSQFVRSFLLPLLAHRDMGVPLRAAFLGRREGLSPEELSRLAPLSLRLRNPYRSLVTIPLLLGRRRQPAVVAPTKEGAADSERADFVVGRILNHLERMLSVAAPRSPPQSSWSAYSRGDTHPDRYTDAKLAAVQEWTRALRPRAVLDIGCNIGIYSEIAARAGATVVAIDSDEAAVSHVYQNGIQSGLDILPLVIDIANPSPASGWRNQEYPSFLSRAAGHFDAVLALAVVHHLLGTERIPLDDILSLLSEITRDAVIVEFVPPSDPMFRLIARERASMFTGLTREGFVSACERRFSIERSIQLGHYDRELFLLRLRDAA